MSLTGQVLRVHEALYKRTDGRLGHHMLGVPALLLRTTGRRSGVVRTNGLVYARDGDDYLVVASNHDRYSAYQEKTTRPIPVVAIRPT